MKKRSTVLIQKCRTLQLCEKLNLPHTHTNTNTHTQTQTHTHTNTHTNTHTQTQTHKHTHKHKHTYKHKHTHAHKHTHTDINTHTNTNTHKHTYNLMHRCRHSVPMKLTFTIKKVWTQKFYVWGRKILKVFPYILHQHIPVQVVLFSPLSVTIPIKLWEKPTPGWKVHHNEKATPSAGARLGQYLRRKLPNPVAYGESQKLH